MTRLLEFDRQHASNTFQTFATLVSEGAAATTALTNAAVSNIHCFNPQDLANTLWTAGTLMVEGQPLSDTSAAQSTRICTEMRPQNLSNWAWSFALAQHRNIPLMGLIAQVAETARIVNELDLQGLANMAWAFSNMQSADSLTFAALGQRLLASPLLDFVDGRSDWNRAANELTHVCQLVWAFSFASRLWPGLEDKLQHALRCIGTYLDNMDPPDLVWARHQRLSSKERPTVVMQLQGISVVFKPPYWEVDAKGQLSGSGLYLSSYMQNSHPSSCVVRMAAFEYGFVHRLDIPSSGLVLVGTSFRGLAGLQWQMHTYSICPRLGTVSSVTTVASCICALH